MHTDWFIDDLVELIQAHDNIFWGIFLSIMFVGIILILAGVYAVGIPISIVFGLLFLMRIFIQILIALDN